MKMQIDISKSPPTRDNVGSSQDTSQILQSFAKPPDPRYFEKEKTERFHMTLGEVKFDFKNPNTQSQSHNSRRDSRNQIASGSNKGSSFIRKRLNLKPIFKDKKDDARVEESLGILVQNQHVSPRLRKKTRIDVQSTLRSAKISDPTESTKQGKRAILDTLRTSCDGRRPEIKEEFQQFERPTTQIYQSQKNKFKTKFKQEENSINEKNQRLLSQQEFKRPINQYGLLSDQKNSRNLLSSCKAAIKRPSIKNTFFTMGQLARNSNCSTAAPHKQTEVESGASVTDPTMIKKPDSTMAKKRIKLDTVGNSESMSDGATPNFYKTDNIKDYIPNGLQPLNFVVAQANESNPYHTQEFDRSIMSGQDTRRKGVHIDHVKLENAKKLAKLDIRNMKTGPRSVHDSLNRDSQRDDQVLGNYRASNFGAFRSKWVASRYEMKRVFSRESKCRGCKLEQIAQKVLTSEDLLKSVQARTSLQSRDQYQPFFEKRRNQQHPFSTLSGYENNQQILKNQKHKKVNLKLAHIEGIQSSTLDGSLLEITKMRHSTNQSPQSLLLDAHVQGTKLQPSFLDKLDNKKLSKHQSQQPSTSMEKTPIAKACISTDLQDVADHGLDKVESNKTPIHPAPIRQQDDLTPEEASESKTDGFIGTKNLITQEAILSSNPSKGKAVMSQLDQKNEPDTALIGHRDIGKSSELFEQEKITAQKKGESTENSKVDISRNRRQPLTIPAPEAIGSDIKSKEAESPSHNSPQYQLKVDLDKVTAQRVLEKDDFHTSAAITDKIENKSMAKIPNNSTKNVKKYGGHDLSNPDLKSIEKRPSDVEIIENLISKTTPRSNSKAKLNQKRTAQHLQQAIEYYNMPQDDMKSMLNTEKMSSSNMMITAGQGDVLSTMNTQKQFQQKHQIHFEDKDEYGDQTPKVIVQTRPFQSHNEVNMKLIDELLYSPTDGTAIQPIKSIDQAQNEQQPRKKNYNKFGRQIYLVLKKYGVLEALDRIDQEQQNWDSKQKAKFDKEMDNKFEKAMGRILHKKVRAASVPKRTVPIIISHQHTMMDAYDKKTDNSPVPHELSVTSDCKSGTKAASPAGSPRNLKINVQQVSSKSRESIKKRKHQVVHQSQHHNQINLHSHESPLQVRFPSYPNSVSPNREKKSVDDFQFIPSDFELPSSQYLKDFFNTHHVKKMSERRDQDTFRLKNMTKAQRIQHVQRQQIFAGRYQQIPDNPKKWRKERNKELIRTITKKLYDSHERSKITEDEDDYMSIETISNMTESSNDSKNIHEQSPYVRKRNKDLTGMIDGLEAKKLAEQTMSSQEKKGEVDTSVQINQNSLALRRLQTTLTQHVLVPKPNFFEMNQERLDHLVELNDNLGPIEIEVFGKTAQKEPLPYLMRLRGCEFSKLYIIQIKPLGDTNSKLSQDLSMTLEYPFQVDQHWYCDDVNLHRSHTIKIIVRPQQQVTGVPQQDVNEFNVFCTLVSKAGCDISIQLICPEKERERNRQQVVAKMMQQMSGKSKNPKAKSKHALAAILKMSKSQVKDVEDDLKNYLKQQRPNWVPSDEIVKTHELPHFIQKNIEELHLANEFNYLQERKDKAYEKELNTHKVQKRKQMQETMKKKEWQDQLNKWENYKQEEALAKEVLIKLLKHGMVVKRWVIISIFGQLVEKLKDIFKMIQEKKKMALAATTIAVRMFILLKRFHKRLGATTQIRNQKIYFQFYLPLLTTFRIDTIEQRAKKCFLETLRKSQMIHMFENHLEFFTKKVEQVQQHFRQMQFKRMCRSKVIMNLFNRERATLMEIIGKKLSSNPGSYGKALTKLQKKLPLLGQEETASMIIDLIKYKQCQSLEKFLELKILIQRYRIKFLIYLKRNSYNINRRLLGFVGMENLEILNEFSQRIAHSEIKIKRWQGICDSLKDRMFDLSGSLFGNMGPKEFVPMLLKQSTKACQFRLDQLYPKEAPKGKKGKKSQQIKLFPTLEEERQKAIQISKKIEARAKFEKTQHTLQANIDELPPPELDHNGVMMDNHHMIMHESEMPVLDWEHKAKIKKQVTEILNAAKNYEDNECSGSEEEDAWKDCDTCYEANKVSAPVSPSKKEKDSKQKAVDPSFTATQFKKVIERCDECKQKKLKRLDKKFEKIIEFYDGHNFIVLFKVFKIARSDYELRDQFEENIEWTQLNPTKEEIIRMVIAAANNAP